MVTGLKAIETVWNGYRFRSRLEARWAVFLDTLGVPYQYEPEGFELDGMRYLPDFWLPEQRCWVEIKPVEPDEPAERKAHALANHSGSMVFIFFGEVWMPATEDFDNITESAYAYFPSVDGWDNQYWWCECDYCGRFGIEYNGRSDRLPCKECGRWDGCGDTELRRVTNAGPCPKHWAQLRVDGCPREYPGGDKGYNFRSPHLVRAYLAARQARFGR
jgi:hypothetical protein